MKKIIPILVVGILVLSGLGVAALNSDIEKFDSETIDYKKHSTHTVLGEYGSEQNNTLITEHGSNRTAGRIIEVDNAGSIMWEKTGLSEPVDAERQYLDNHPPDAPKITGPQLSKPGTHEWAFKAIDPDEDDIYYWIEWDDDSFEKWSGPYASGEEVTLNHTYSGWGNYVISAKAKDIHGAIGDWGYLEVIIPKGKQIINPIFFRFLGRFFLMLE